MSRVRHLLHARGVVVLLPVACGIAGIVLTLGDAGTGRAQEPDGALGARLYSTHCAGCHGADHAGVENRGPSLQPEGEASTDFVLRTGRMPLADPEMQAQRGPVRFTNDEIVALVAYVGSIGDGPAIPDVDPTRGNLADGGELYRLNCAACHVASGAGAPIGGGRQAPNLLKSTPTQVGQAIIVGPGSMPVFGTLESAEIDGIAAYVESLKEQNTTGPSSFGGAGPVAEGLAAWLLGLIPLIALTRWIGSPQSGRDPDELAAGPTAGVVVEEAT